MCLAVALFAFCRLGSWAEESVLPKQFSVDRYAAMRAHSPFAIATGTPAPGPPQPSFAANWFVSGIARIGDTDYVTIKGRDLSTQFALFGHEPNPQNQVVMVSIDWADGIGKSSVTVRKGSETAKLEFNEAVVHGPPQGATAQNAATTGKGPIMPPAAGPNAGTKQLPVTPTYNPSQRQRVMPMPVSAPAINTNRILPQPSYQTPTRPTAIPPGQIR